MLPQTDPKARYALTSALQNWRPSGGGLNDHDVLKKKAASGWEAALSSAELVVDQRSSADDLRDELRDLPARLRLTIGHLNVFRTIRITLKRLFAAEMEVLGPRLT